MEIDNKTNDTIKQLINKIDCINQELSNITSMLNMLVMHNISDDCSCDSNNRDNLEVDHYRHTAAKRKCTEDIRTTTQGDKIEWQ